MTELKKCKGVNGCGETKPIEEFGWSSTLRRHTNCKTCHNASQKEIQAAKKKEKGNVNNYKKDKSVFGEAAQAMFRGKL